MKYAVERLLVKKRNDYWLQASALELAVHQLDQAKVKEYLGASLRCNPDTWSRQSTAKNLQAIYDKALENSSKEQLQWLQDFINELA